MRAQRSSYIFSVLIPWMADASCGAGPVNHGCYVDNADLFSYATDVCWMLKEFFWILLIPYACVPFGAMALVCIIGCVLCQNQESHFVEQFPLALATLWLSGNFIWMVAEVWYDAPDVQTPWALTPLGGEDPVRYEQIKSVAKLCFLAGPTIYLCVLGIEYWRLKPGMVHRRHFTFLVLQGHLATWCLKDYLWTGSYLKALIADCATVGLVLCNVAVLSGGGLAGMDRAHASWLLWLAANMVWVAMEGPLGGSLTCRYVAATISGLGVILMLCSFQQVQNSSKATRLFLAASNETPESSVLKSGGGTYGYSALPTML